MKQEKETYLLNGSRMPGQAGTITKMHYECPRRCQNEARKGNISIKRQQNARTGRDNYKNALRMPRAVPE